MFKDLSLDELEDLLDLEVKEYAADTDAEDPGDPSCGVCLCCYGGCGCCA